MAWEERERGGRYYTRSRKVAGRVIREYVGTGEVAELIARGDALDRRRREERERLDALDAGAGEADYLAELLARASFLAAGYRQHERGEWRKPRERD